MIRCHYKKENFSAGKFHTEYLFLSAAMLLFFFTYTSTLNASPSSADPKVPLLTEEQAETLSKESDQTDDIPMLDEESEEMVDALQQEGSEMLINAASWLDSFFYDPRFTEEENRSWARLKLKFGYSRFYDFEFKPSIDLNIHLPKLNNKVDIYITANDDRDFNSDSTPIPDTPGGRQNTDEQLTAGVRYLLAMGKSFNLTTHFGVSLGYVYGGVRYRHTHPFFSDEWDGRLTDRLRWYSDDGWENRLTYDIESHISDRYFFRTSFNTVVAERFDGVPSSGIMQLYRILNIDKAVLFESGVYLDTDPEFTVTDIQLKIRYRQRFFREWLVLEIGPQLTFPEDHDYKINPGIIVKFEAEFGYLNDRKAYQSIFSF